MDPFKIPSFLGQCLEGRSRRLSLIGTVDRRRKALLTKNKFLFYIQHCSFHCSVLAGLSTKGYSASYFMRIHTDSCAVLEKDMWCLL